MNAQEPSLFSHLYESRQALQKEGGLSFAIYCGRARSEGDVAAALQLHTQVVEDEVNKEEANISGILIGQVS